MTVCEFWQTDRRGRRWGKRLRSSDSEDISAGWVHCVSCWAGYRWLRVFDQEGEVVGEVKSFKFGAAEAVDQRVQETVHVWQDHEAVEGHGCFVLGDLACLLDTGDQQDHPGQGAGQEAEGKDHHDAGHQEHGPLQLRPVPDGLLPQPVDDAHGAVDQDDEGDDDLREEDHLSQTVHHILKLERRQKKILGQKIPRWN